MLNLLICFLDLARMFKLFSRVPDGLKNIREAVSAHFKGEGEALVKSGDNKDALAYIEVIIPFQLFQLKFI